MERCPVCGDQLCEVCAGMACEAGDCPRLGPEGTSWAFPVPWEHRRSLGWWRAFTHTIGRLVVRPGRFFEALPWRGSAALPVAFAALCFALGAGVVLVGVAWSDLPGSLVPLLLLLLALPFVGAYRAGGMALLLWVGLGVLEGRARPFAAVLRVSCYALGADLLLPIAGVGVYAGTVLQVVAMRRGLGVRLWRAVLVAALPLALFHLVVLGALALYLALSGQRF
jgi:hypothetical protein